MRIKVALDLEASVFSSVCKVAKVLVMYCKCQSSNLFPACAPVCPSHTVFTVYSVFTIFKPRSPRPGLGVSSSGVIFPGCSDIRGWRPGPAWPGSHRAGSQISPLAKQLLRRARAESWSCEAACERAAAS